MNDDFYEITACYGRLYHLQELRGRFQTQASAGTTGPDAPPAGWNGTFFFGNMWLSVRLFSEGVRKNSPLAGQKRLLGKHLAPHGDKNCRNVLHITETCTSKWGERLKFCRFFRLKWDENSI